MGLWINNIVNDTEQRNVQKYKKQQQQRWEQWQYKYDVKWLSNTEYKTVYVTRKDSAHDFLSAGRE